MGGNQGIPTFKYETLYDFAVSVLNAAGVRDDVSTAVARALLHASLRGVDSHGIRLLPHYVSAVERGRINGSPNYGYRRTAGSTATLDADHTFGHAAGLEAIGKAVEIAEEAGTGNVAVYNSSHYGSSSFYALEAARRDFIGFSFTHANALLNTPGSKRPFFGLNPICVAVPCEGEEPFCFDSSPALITWNKILQLREQNAPAPAFSGADSEGNETRDPHKITQLLPIGGYKGFGLAMVVDILCGLLTGMPVGRDITDMYNTPLTEKRRLGQFYIAIKIDAFQPLAIFKKRVKQMIDAVRAEPRKSQSVEILVPGDPEKRVMAERLARGVPVPQQDLQRMSALAGQYRLQPLH